MKFDSLQDRVVVITGASSGVGRLAVERFLEEGAKVVLAARSEQAMRTHIEKLGGNDERALVVPTDVSDYEQVSHLAGAALAKFGRIDIWINNAGVNLYGLIEELQPDDIKRVIETNLLGEIFGAKAVIPIFKQQGFGNLLNVSSITGKVAMPYTTAYTASKFGIVGFTSVVREEVMRNYPEIGVSVLLPNGLDTPLFEHAKSELGVEPKPIPPSDDPMILVNALMENAKNPKPEVFVGRAAPIMGYSQRLMPRQLEKLMALVGFGGQRTNIPKQIEGDDNLRQAAQKAHRVRGNLGTTGQNIADYARSHPYRMVVSAGVPLLLALGVNQLRKRFT